MTEIPTFLSERNLHFRIPTWIQKNHVLEEDVPLQTIEIVALHLVFIWGMRGLSVFPC